MYSAAVVAHTSLAHLFAQTYSLIHMVTSTGLSHPSLHAHTYSRPLPSPQLHLSVKKQDN